MQRKNNATTLFVCIILVVDLSGSGEGTRQKGEIPTFGRHELVGQRVDQSYKGSLSLSKDARFSLKRRFADGREESDQGSVSIYNRSIQLTSKQGGRRVTRSYTRNIVDGRVSWTWKHPKGSETFTTGPRAANSLQVFGRLLRRRKGVTNYLLNMNEGYVDSNPKALILRSKLPNTEYLRRLKRERGLRTVLTLNGSLKKDVTYRRRKADGSLGRVVTTTFDQFIKDEGLQHVIVNMSSTRAAPRDVVLTAFKALMDDSKKPILMHCNGGADRTGLMSALYRYEFLAWSKEKAKAEMRKHLWSAHKGTDIKGVELDLYQKGQLRAWLKAEGVKFPRRFQSGLQSKPWY